MKDKILKLLLITLLLAPGIVCSEIYKCNFKGHITYQSDPCNFNEKNRNDQVSTFDGWAFGMHISSMKQRARERQLVISPGSHVYVSKFNEKHLNSKTEERKYTYKTNIFGKYTTVTLYFTQTTGKLYEIKTTFHVSQIKPEERKYFYESLYKSLTNKYGQAQNIQTEAVKKNSEMNPLGSLLTRSISDTFIGSLFAWGLNTDNVVTLSYKKNYQTMLSYKLTYKNIPLAKLNESEENSLIKKRTNHVMSRDMNRL